MADLYPTPARRLLLEDIDAGRVIDDEDFAPHLHHDEGTSRVAEAVWLMRAAGWCEQVTTDRKWSLTPLGRDVLDGKGSASQAPGSPAHARSDARHMGGRT